LVAAFSYAERLLQVNDIDWVKVSRVNWLEINWGYG
jgi:hypothetical protein